MARRETGKTLLIAKVRAKLPLLATYSPTMKKPKLKKFWFYQADMGGTFKQECKVTARKDGWVDVEYWDWMVERLCQRTIRLRELHYL